MHADTARGREGGSALFVCVVSRSSASSSLLKYSTLARSSELQACAAFLFLLSLAGAGTMVGVSVCVWTSSEGENEKARGKEYVTDDP